MFGRYIESVQNGEEKEKRKRGCKRKSTTNHRQAPLEPPKKKQCSTPRRNTYTHAHYFWEKQNKQETVLKTSKHTFIGTGQHLEVTLPTQAEVISFVPFSRACSPTRKTPTKYGPRDFQLQKKKKRKKLKCWKPAKKVWEQVKKAKLKGCRVNQSNGNLQLLSSGCFNGFKHCASWHIYQHWPLNNEQFSVFHPSFTLLKTQQEKNAGQYHQ